MIVASSSENGQEFGSRENFIRRENLRSANNICPRLHLANYNEPRILYIDTTVRFILDIQVSKNPITLMVGSLLFSLRGSNKLGEVRRLSRLQVSQPNRPAIMARLKSNMEEHPAGKNRMKDTFHPREIVA
jgi:hypothetical protein